MLLVIAFSHILNETLSPNEEQTVHRLYYLQHNSYSYVHLVTVTCFVLPMFSPKINLMVSNIFLNFNCAFCNLTLLPWG